MCTSQQHLNAAVKVLAYLKHRWRYTLSSVNKCKTTQKYDRIPSRTSLTWIAFPFIHVLGNLCFNPDKMNGSQFSRRHRKVALCRVLQCNKIHRTLRARFIARIHEKFITTKEIVNPLKSWKKLKYLRMTKTGQNWIQRKFKNSINSGNRPICCH
jgi:hypothetical protein